MVRCCEEAVRLSRCCHAAAAKITCGKRSGKITPQFLQICSSGAVKMEKAHSRPGFCIKIIAVYFKKLSAEATPQRAGHLALCIIYIVCAL